LRIRPYTNKSRRRSPKSNNPQSGLIGGEAALSS
jgi:hypothetical protein